MADEMPFVCAPARGMAVRGAGERARRQFGAIARWQLLETGNSPDRVRNWVRSGHLHPIMPGVYAWGRPELGTDGEHAAALLYSGRGSALTGLTALWWRKLLNRRPEPIHLDAPGRTRPRPGLRISHPAAIDRTWHRGLPVAALPRALLAAAPSLSHNALRLVLARAEFEDLLDLTAIEAALAGRPRGARPLRAAIGAHLPQLARCANGLERSYVLLLERHGIPLPEPNARIGRYRPDMLWREPMLVVELDGARAHHTTAQLAADARRQADLEELGYRVRRFARREVEREPDRVAAETARLLAA